MTKNTKPATNAGSRRVLLTGAGGLIGRRLTDKLLEQGHTLHHLVRDTSKKDPRVRSFSWDVYARHIDPSCIDGVDTVIHLAGEPIADKAWTDRRKRQLVESRTESIRLIYGLLEKERHHVTTVISASAVGFYGDRGNDWLTEESVAGTGFLAECCTEWERAVDEAPAGVRVVKFRTGVVLQENDGALRPMATTVKLGIGAPLGSGKQWLPWIHVDDAVAMYVFAVDSDTIDGTFNMVAPVPETNAMFTKALGRVLHRPVWLPNVPAFALRLLMGERYHVATDSARVSADKIRSAGFDFSYVSAETALHAIYG